MDTTTKKLISLNEFASIMDTGKMGSSTLETNTFVSNGKVGVNMTIVVGVNLYRTQGANQDECIDLMLEKFRGLCGSAETFRHVFSRAGM